MKVTRYGDAGARSVGVAQFLLSVVVVLLEGCAGSVKNPFQEANRVGATTPSVLEVDNHYWADMTILVRRGSQVIRLGQVTTNHRDRFEIPTTAMGAGILVTFVADPVGSGTVHESPLVALGNGESYVWTLAVHIEHSTLVRR